MSNQTIKDLIAQGVSREDIELAKATQAAQRAAGHPVQSLAVLCGVAKPRQRTGGMVQAGAAARPDGTDEVTRRALRSRGAYDQAALILTQQALHESSPERAVLARQAAETAKTLSLSQQLEFDFFGGGQRELFT